MEKDVDSKMRMGLVMYNAGFSIFITSVSDILIFFVAYFLVNLQVLHDFCVGNVE